MNKIVYSFKLIVMVAEYMNNTVNNLLKLDVCGSHRLNLKVLKSLLTLVKNSH